MQKILDSLQGPLASRLFELFAVAVVSGIVSGLTTIKTMEYDVSALKVSVSVLNSAVAAGSAALSRHEERNLAQEERERELREVDLQRLRADREEDRKWLDARLRDMERCFVRRIECGLH